jgi:hypothetical protein
VRKDLGDGQRLQVLIGGDVSGDVDSPVGTHGQSSSNGIKRSRKIK